MPIARLHDSKVGARDVPLGDHVLAYVATLPRDSEWICPAAPFAGVKPGHVHAQRVWTDLSEVSQLAGLRGISPHVMRHTWITHALLAGVPIEFVRVAAGHSTAFMTSRYGHLAAREVRSAATIVADRIASFGPTLRVVKAGQS